MHNKIIICGGNGAGKSTLGKALADKLNYKFMDIEDYYFPKSESDYPYAAARTRTEVSSLLLEDMKKYPNFILASVKGDYGEEVISLFTYAIWISVPKNIRLERVRGRSFQKFGNRILPDGDLYEKEKNFFDMVQNRSEQDVENWLKSTCIPMIQVDGTNTVPQNIEIIIDKITDFQPFT